MSNFQLIKKLSVMMTAVILFAVSCMAQDAEIQKAMSRYKGVKSVNATVVRTKHRAALSEDEVLAGSLAFNTPDKLMISFNNGDEKMYMDGSTFAMTSGSQESVAKGATQTQFESLLAVFKNIFFGDTSAGDIDKLAEVTTEAKGNLRIISVTPVTSADGKKKRQMFSSFVVTFDVKAGEFKSLRMNERGENYTHYDFSDFKLK